MQICKKTLEDQIAQSTKEISDANFRLGYAKGCIDLCKHFIEKLDHSEDKETEDNA